MKHHVRKREAEQVYRLSIVCRQDDEIQVRTLMLHMLNGIPHLVVQSLHSEDLPSGTQLEVRADLITSPSNHLQLEKIVRIAARISDNGCIKTRTVIR